MKERSFLGPFLFEWVVIKMILKEIYEQIASKYGMCCVTGEQTLETYIAWTHVIEDSDVAAFERKNELICTTGIASTGERWLMEFVKRLSLHHASGLVVCLGPYIMKISDEVKEYCINHEFCLMTLPWDVHLSDVTKDISYMVLEQEKKMVTIIHAMKDAIFYANEKSVYMPHLKRYGYRPDKNFCPIVLQVRNKGKSSRDRALWLQFFQNLMRFYFEKIVIFEFTKQIVVILYDQDEEGVGLCMEKIMAFEARYQDFDICYAGIGPNVSNIKNLAGSYQIAKDITSLAKSQKQKVMAYGNLGIYQILIVNKDKHVLKNYYQQTLGSLEQYDENHGTDYFRLLKVYLDTDCSVRETAMEEYCHRNTINKRIHKIKQILGRQHILPKDKLELGLAYAIHVILQ